MIATETSTGGQGKQSWLRLAWQQPRKLLLRRAFFQVHLWAGIAVGIISTVVGLSGSALVYREALDRLLAPKLHKVRPGSAMTVDQIIKRVRSELPGMKMQYIDLAEKENSWVVYIQRQGQKPGMVYVDLSTGALLGERGEQQGVMPWLAELHYRLLGGATGQKINGLGAALLFLLSVTGVILWWPGRKSVRRSIRIHWKGRWPRLQWDLHTAGGFWVSLPLTLISISGVYFSFGLPVIGIVLTLLGGSPKDFAKLLESPHSIIPAAMHTAAPLQPMIDLSRAHFSNAERVFLQLPANPEDSVRLFVQTPDRERVGGRAQLFFDQYTGSLIREDDSRNAPFSLRAYFFLNAIHFGVFAGNLSKIVWVLVGLSPGVLFLTGFLIWLRRMRNKFKIKRNTANKVVIAANGGREHGPN